jgi:hypothetical protein
MGMSGGSVTGISGAGSGGAGYWIAADREMAGQYGWTGPEFDALVALWTAESNWDPNAVNPNGGAYGIPRCRTRFPCAGAASSAGAARRAGRRTRG